MSLRGQGMSGGDIWLQWFSCCINQKAQQDYFREGRYEETSSGPQQTAHRPLDDRRAHQLPAHGPHRLGRRGAGHRHAASLGPAVPDAEQGRLRDCHQGIIHWRVPYFAAF
ncbi:hypothetical protein B566_EDAN011511 [Ephemera danica]|nr:hypothetical protein B566_EDAN011511 [Ephemera danica]